MKIIREHLQQMKVEQPEQYTKLMNGYTSEDELIRDISGLSKKAIEGYYQSFKPVEDKDDDNPGHI